MSVLGVWMWPQSVSDCGAHRVIDRCVRTGITDIYFLAKGLAGTASFRSRFAPMVCDRDLLGELLTAAHARGVRVHAWLTSLSKKKSHVIPTTERPDVSLQISVRRSSGQNLPFRKITGIVPHNKEKSLCSTANSATPV